MLTVVKEPPETEEGLNGLRLRALTPRLTRNSKVRFVSADGREVRFLGATIVDTEQTGRRVGDPPLPAPELVITLDLGEEQ
jgi:hypothetical protein